MDSGGHVKPCQVLMVLVGHRPSPISRKHPLSSFPLLHVLGMFGKPVVDAKPFLPRTPAMRTHDMFRTFMKHVMVSQSKWNVQLTRATLSLSTHAVGGSFVSYQTASWLFGAGGAPWHSTRSWVHWIAIAPSRPQQLGGRSSYLSMPSHMESIQHVHCAN